MHIPFVVHTLQYRELHDTAPWCESRSATWVGHRVTMSNAVRHKEFKVNRCIWKSKNIPRLWPSRSITRICHRTITQTCAVHRDVGSKRNLQQVPVAAHSTTARAQYNGAEVGRHRVGSGLKEVSHHGDPWHALRNTAGITQTVMSDIGRHAAQFLPLICGRPWPRASAA